MKRIVLLVSLLLGMIISVKTLVLSGPQSMRALLRRSKAPANIKYVSNDMIVATVMDGKYRLKSTRLHSTSASSDVDAQLDTPDAMHSSFKSPFLQTMLERGFIHQCTDFKTLDEKFMSGTVTAYLGFDATANSLHVGSLLQV